jgi:gliding motility-associated-like protein
MKRLIPFLIFLSIGYVCSAQCNYTVSATPNTAFCDNLTVQLNASISGTPPTNPIYSWSPTTGLNNPNIANPTATVTGTTTYTVQVSSTSSVNLVTNGGFESGNTGFTTGYPVGTGGTWGPVSIAGTYLITNNPQTAHSNYVACADHTPNPGANMMVVNGATTANTNLWCQNITVTPNTTYKFSMWATSTVASVPAVLQVSFNGIAASSNLNLPLATCSWQEYTATWNSGNNNSLSLCVTNLILAGSGNDFAIDDISLSPICLKSASVELTSNAVPTTDLDKMACVGDSVLVGGAFQFSGGVYVDTLTSFHGCDSIIITNLVFKEAIKPDLGTDTTLCGNEPISLFSALPAVSYLWNTGSTNDSITVTTAGEYILKITDNKGCSKSDTIRIDYNEYPVVQLGNDTMLCLGESFTLRSEQTFSGATYKWHDGSNSFTYPVLEPGGTYNLTVSNGLCTDFDEIIVQYEACQCRVGVPNVFSPNEDGINDKIVLMAENGCAFINYRFQVFNRLGELIFSTTNLNEGWNGVWNGLKLPQDTYVWKLNYELDPRFKTEPVQETGTLLLLR